MKQISFTGLEITDKDIHEPNNKYECRWPYSWTLTTITVPSGFLYNYTDISLDNVPALSGKWDYRMLTNDLFMFAFENKQDAVTFKLSNPEQHIFRQ